MQIIQSEDTYTYVLDEAEWYGINSHEQCALTHQCEGAAKDRGCRVAAIFVRPDPFLSISPNPRRHRVWQSVAPMPAAEQFREELTALKQEALKAGVTAHEMAIIVGKVFS